MLPGFALSHYFIQTLTGCRFCCLLPINQSDHIFPPFRTHMQTTWPLFNPGRARETQNRDISDAPSTIFLIYSRLPFSVFGQRLKKTMHSAAVQEN
jgi:hypothetical protein